MQHAAAQNLLPGDDPAERSLDTSVLRGYQVCNVILNMADLSQLFKRTCLVDEVRVTFTAPITVMWIQFRILDIIYAMALAKRESQLYVSALAKQTAKESDKKCNVKVLDEETYVQVRTLYTAGIMLNLARITNIFKAILVRY